MEKTLPNRQSFWSNPLCTVRALCTTALLLTSVSGSAFAQAIAVTGTVTSGAGGPLQGVTVRVVGAELRAVTNATGKYSILAPSTATLSFTKVGQKPILTPIAGRATVNVAMDVVAYLEEVVVTGYAEQRRADITGAVASVNIESAQRPTSASILQRLDAVPGITVASNGTPGSRSTVRIRGISSFQNNDPLYVIDGVPVQDSYINFINPNDISSVQVLKDASSASIYGSRASNGVILIETTKRGASGPPKMVATVRTGIASPTNGYDKFLITNSLDYFQVLKTAYTNAGLAIPTNVYGDPNNPSVPAYTFAAPSTRTGVDAFGRPTGVDVTKYSFPNSLIQGGSEGTNWWNAVFGKPAKVQDLNLSITGSGESNGYGVSLNYFNQDGTAAYNNFRRANIRVNTSFTRNKFTFGENVAFSAQRAYGGLPDDNTGETAILGKNILMQPVVPIYDVMGNFASGKAVSLGNNTNPLKAAYEARNNINGNNRVFGNAYAGLALTPSIALRSSFGFSVNQGSSYGYNPITPENSEPNFSNGIFDNANRSNEFTLSNTATYTRQKSLHGFTAFLGQEVIKGTNRSINSSLANLLSTDENSRFVQDALGDATTKVVNSFGGHSALLSFFGKADYNYNDKYVASATVRRDGSSRLGPNNRYGTFPAVGLGWRISKEKFLENNSILSDAMLRFGYGVTGNQSIPTGRTVDQYGGSNGDTYYDITGSNGKVGAGYRQTSLGNPDLKWEENRSKNLGADLALFRGAINVIIDVYDRTSENVLFNPPIPATAGYATAPIVNIGSVNNKGYDLSIGHQGANWNATLTGSAYRNKIVKIDGNDTKFFSGPTSTRIGNMIRNQLDNPIGSFFGLRANGYYKDAADVAAGPKQDGAKPGRLKFVDVNGDGRITSDDREIIGNPHPDFTGGLDLGYRIGNFDLSGSVFGSFGNQIFDAQKDFYVFRDFSTNVRKDLVAGSWTPQNLDAKYPILDQSDTFSRAISSYYVEDGSYIRMRNVQLGYNVPASMSRFLSATRIYIQGENLFTITGYSGLDPALPAGNASRSGSDVRDQFRGVDTGVYPSNRTFSFGVSTSF